MKEDKKFEYLVDILINVGAWILFYYLVIPKHATSYYTQGLKDNAQIIMIGFIVFTLGVNMLIRRYIGHKN